MTLGRDLWVGVAPVVPVVLLEAAVAGVLVLEAAAPTPPFSPSCFVGLLVGLLKPLRPVLAPGVGLAVPATALVLRTWPASCFFAPLTPACKLEGRDRAAPGAPGTVVAGLGFGCGCGCSGCSGCSRTCLTPAERKNIP